MHALALDVVQIVHADSGMQGLEGAVGLKALVVSFNELSSMEGLASLTRLTRLDLSFNAIPRIQGLKVPQHMQLDWCHCTWCRRSRVVLGHIMPHHRGWHHSRSQTVTFHPITPCHTIPHHATPHHIHDVHTTSCGFNVLDSLVQMLLSSVLRYLQLHLAMLYQ